jgi:hypothetical protein
LVVGGEPGLSFSLFLCVAIGAFAAFIGDAVAAALFAGLPA